MKHNSQAIRTMQEFVSGKMPIEAFKEEFCNNPAIKEALKNDPLLPEKLFLYRDEKDLVAYLGERCNWNTRRGQVAIWGELEWFLERYGYSFEEFTYYWDRLVFLVEIQPNWLEIQDEDFLINEIISKVPEGLSEPKKKAWCKAKIKELFKYDKSPPRWASYADWPIVNGKPLVFKSQSKVGDDDSVKYYFYDPDTKEETIVEQFY